LKHIHLNKESTKVQLIFENANMSRSNLQLKEILS